MLGKTHKAGGCFAMLIGFHYLQAHYNIAENIHPIVQLMIMYPVSSWASTAPDLDQNDQAIPEKTPFSYLVHKLLQLCHSTHRSWQTHSWLITGGLPLLLYFLLNYVESVNLAFMPFSVVSYEIMRLLLIAFMFGLYSHLLLDSLTKQGVWLLPKVHFRLVPPKKFFGTGTTYENIIRNLLYVAIAIYLLILVTSYFAKF